MRDVCRLLELEADQAGDQNEVEERKIAKQCTEAPITQKRKMCQFPFFSKVLIDLAQRQLVRPGRREV